MSLCLGYGSIQHFTYNFGAVSDHWLYTQVCVGPCGVQVGRTQGSAGPPGALEPYLLRYRQRGALRRITDVWDIAYWNTQSMTTGPILRPEPELRV